MVGLVRLWLVSILVHIVVVVVAVVVCTVLLVSVESVRLAVDLCKGLRRPLAVRVRTLGLVLLVGDG